MWSCKSLMHVSTSVKISDDDDALGHGIKGTCPGRAVRAAVRAASESDHYL